MTKLMMSVVVAIVLTSGCASDPAAKPWWSLAEANFRSLQPGVATQADVRSALGTPLQSTRFPRQGEEAWDYRYLDGSMQMLAWVFFDGQGRYKYYVGQPDPARYSCIGG
jgi:outer membrane protein assembly factor BamE (lipoprotein component of BamABCDE complex)